MQSKMQVGKTGILEKKSKVYRITKEKINSTKSQKFVNIKSVFLFEELSCIGLTMSVQRSKKNALIQFFWPDSLQKDWLVLRKLGG